MIKIIFFHTIFFGPVHFDDRIVMNND
jgi:hypothetical protein